MLKIYNRGYPCKLGKLLGRISGETRRGKWEISPDGVRYYSKPCFVTPLGTFCIVDFTSLDELSVNEITALRINEMYAYKNHRKKFYADRVNLKYIKHLSLDHEKR